MTTAEPAAKTTIHRAERHDEPAGSRASPQYPDLGGPAGPLERAREIDLVTEAVDHIKEGRIVVLRGEPGAGKTTLVDLADRYATDRGVRVLRARGRRLEAMLGWGGLRQLLPDILPPSLDDDPVPPSVDVALDDEERLPRSLVRVGPFGHGPSGAPSRRLEIADRACTRLLALAAREPVLLLVDDAQWLDVPTLQFCCYLAHRIEGTALSVVAAVHMRLDESRDRLVDDLAHAPVARLRELEPLSTGAVRALLCEALDPAAADAHAEACRTAAGGNPRLTIELVAELRRRSSDAGAGGDALVRALRPPSVTRSVIGQLAALAPEVREVVEALAVLGGGTETYILAAVVGASAETTTVLVDRAADAHLLTHGRPPEFAHPLVEAAVLEQLSPGRRSVLHGRAHEAIAMAGGDVSAIAAHLLRVEPAGRPDVVETLRRAARRAAAAGDPSTAEVMLRRAGREQAADDPDIEEDLGRLLVGGPRHRFAIRCLERARALRDDPEDRCRIDLLLAGAHFQRGGRARAMAVLQRGLAEPLDGNHDLHRELAAALAAIDGADSGVGTAPGGEGDDATALGRLAFGRAAIVALRAGDVPHGIVAARARIAWSPQLDPSQHVLDAITLPSATLALLCADDVRGAETRLDGEVRRATAAGSRMSLATASFLRGIARHARGALPEAVEDWQVALDAAAGGWVFALPACRALRAFAALDRDEHPVVPVLLALPGGDAPWRAHPSYPYVLLVRGLAADSRGRHEEALDLVLAAGALQERRGIANPALLPWQADAAVLAHRLGRAAQAESLVEELLERCDAFGSKRMLGIARRTAATVGRGDPGALLEEAVQAFDAVDARLETARTLFVLGAWHRAAGRSVDARPSLERAVDLAHAAGASAIARRAANELRAAGGYPRSGGSGRPADLTAAERRVARRAAAGRTNRAIAEELVVSLRTVESHLTRVYAKLGTTRNGLAATIDAVDDDDVVD